jgi:hypothetical protein
MSAGGKLLLYLASRAALLAGQTNLAPEVTAGTNSGQGNQGSSNTAHTTGQAGVNGDRFQSTRQMQFGAGSGVSRP